MLWFGVSGARGAIGDSGAVWGEIAGAEMGSMGFLGKGGWRAGNRGIYESPFGDWEQYRSSLGRNRLLSQAETGYCLRTKSVMTQAKIGY